MRPVSITQITAQEYDETGELGRNKRIKDFTQPQQQGTQAQATTSTTITVDTLIQNLQSLIDKWVNDGALMQKEGNAWVKVWKDPADAKLYKLLNSAHIDGYGNARRALITRLGQICSYCEAPVFSHMHVEHRMPKNSFPSKALAWSNFLISCPTCNTIKGDKPTQQTPAGLKSTTDALTYNANNYFWPQAYWNSFQDGTPFPFHYELMKLGPKGSKWEFNEIILEKDWGTYLTLYQNGTIKVKDGKVAIPKDLGYYIGLRLSASSTLSPDQQTIVNSTLELTDQNKLPDAVKGQTSIDRRVELRTFTFFKALIIADRLNQVLGSNNQVLYNAVLKQAKATIAATGFWSVWFYFLRLEKLSSAQIQALLGGLFPGTAGRTWA